jgi:hypothetical protein
MVLRSSLVGAFLVALLLSSAVRAQQAEFESMLVPLPQMPQGTPFETTSKVKGRLSERYSLRSKPRTPVRFPKARFIVLSACVYGAALADMHQTLEVRKNSWWYETDPLARPFARLPAPAYYATGLAMATGINWLSWKMGRSRHWRKLSPIPQLLIIAGNLYGFHTNRYRP